MRDPSAEYTFRARVQHQRVRSRNLCRRHERQRTTNRRSTWAGVSWLNEDADNAGELGVLLRTRVAIRRRQLMPELTTDSARSSACSRGKLHARSSSPGGSARRRLSIEVKS